MPAFLRPSQLKRIPLLSPLRWPQREREVLSLQRLIRAKEDAQLYLFSVDAAGDVVFPASFRSVAVSAMDGVELVEAARGFVEG